MTDQEINEAIAKKLGWNLIHHDDSTPAPYTTMYRKETFIEEIILPDYCHSIEAVWEIANRHPFVMINGYRCQFLVKKEKNKKWAAGWICIDADGEWVEGDLFYADTAPMAICLAFLKLP